MADNGEDDAPDIDDVSKQLSESCVLDSSTCNDQSAGLTADTDAPTLDKASQTESHDQSPFDYSKLPFCAWFKILLYLEERDRLMMSVTCKTVHDYCVTTSVLWRSAIIYIGEDSHLQLNNLMLNKTARSVLAEHGHNITNVIFQLKELMGLSISSESYSILEEAVQSWKLSSLDIRFTGEHNTIAPFEDVMPKCVEKLLLACIISPSSSDMVSLHIWALGWVKSCGQSAALAALKCSSFTSSLRRLYLEMPMHPAYDLCELASVVARYPNLQRLAIPMMYLSSDLQNNLSGTLEEIYLIMYSRNWEDDNNRVWPRIVELSRKIRVGVVYVGHLQENTVPHVLPSLFQESTVAVPSTDGSPGKLKVIAPMCSDHMRVVNHTKNDVRVDLEEELIESFRFGCYEDNHVFRHGRTDEVTHPTRFALAKLKQWRMMEVDAMPIVQGDSRHKIEELQKLCYHMYKYLQDKWKRGSEPCVINVNTPGDPLYLKILPQGITV